MTAHKRRARLVRNSFQVKLVGAFVGLAGLALLLQFLFLSYRLSTKTAQIDGGSGELFDEVPGILLEAFAISLLIFLPIIFAIGIQLTFRIAGPVYRFEQYLRSVARGEQVGPCKIREGDQLTTLCELINEATAPLRREAKVASEETSEQDELAAAG